jgi:hypothetical protein
VPLLRAGSRNACTDLFPTHDDALGVDWAAGAVDLATLVPPSKLRTDDARDLLFHTALGQHSGAAFCRQAPPTSVLQAAGVLGVGTKLPAPFTKSDQQSTGGWAQLQAGHK